MRCRSVVIGLAVLAAIFLALLVAWLGVQRERPGRDHGVAAAHPPDTTGSPADERGAGAAALVVVELPTRHVASGTEVDATPDPVRGRGVRTARWPGSLA